MSSSSLALYIQFTPNAPEAIHDERLIGLAYPVRILLNIRPSEFEYQGSTSFDS